MGSILDLLQVDLLANGARLFRLRSDRPSVPRHIKFDEGLFWKSSSILKVVCSSRMLIRWFSIAFALFLELDFYVVQLTAFPKSLLSDESELPTTCGGVCGLVFNSSNPGSGGLGFKPRPSRLFLHKELNSTLSLFTQVYEWVPATYCWG